MLLAGEKEQAYSQQLNNFQQRCFIRAQAPLSRIPTVCTYSTAAS